MSLTVLHAIPSLVGGGAERQLSLLAPELCRLGVATHVAYVHGGVNLPALKASPVGLHHVDCTSNHDPRILLNLVRLIRDLRPDVVQTWLLQMDVFAGLAAMLTGTTFVLSERSSSACYSGNWKYVLRRSIGRHADVVVANSQGGINYWGKSPGARHLIRNGLSLDVNHDSEPVSTESLGLAANARIILFAGRLSSEKNIATLLEAFDQVLASRPDTAAVLFGEGPLREALQAKIARLGVSDRVRLAGFTPELGRWMHRASALVSISLFEGHPNAVLEAAALGCPLVVSSIEQHSEILSGSSALFCDPTSPVDVARAIVAILDNPKAAATRAAAAKHLAKSWSISTSARNYLQLYQHLATHRTPQEERSKMR